MSKKQLNFRLNDEYIRMLNEIAEAINDTKTGAIEYAIFFAHDEILKGVKAD